MVLSKLKITELESLYNLAKAMHEKADRIASDTRNLGSREVQTELRRAFNKVRKIEEEIKRRIDDIDE